MPDPNLVYDAESIIAFLRGKDLVKGVLGTGKKILIGLNAGPQSTTQYPIFEMESELAW